MSYILPVFRTAIFSSYLAASSKVDFVSTFQKIYLYWLRGFIRIMRGRWKLGLNAMPISSLRSTCHETSFFIEMLPWPSADHRQLFPTSDSFLHFFSCFQEKKINRGICFHSNIAAKLFQSKELTWLQWPTTAAILHNKVLRWFFLKRTICSLVQENVSIFALKHQHLLTTNQVSQTYRGSRYTSSKLSWNLKNIAKLAESTRVRGNSF